MSPGRIVLWRHGRTEYNLARRFQGHVDIPLDDVGREQAAAAAEVLARLDPAVIVSSDLSRARETAGALAAAVDLDVVEDARLRERSYGQWEGLAASEIETRYPADFRRWHEGGDPLDSGVEPRAAAAVRALPVVTEYGAGLGQGDTLVLVSHGGLTTCLASVLLDLDPGGWLGLRGMDNCHWALLDANEGRVPAWRLAGYNIGW